MLRGGRRGLVWLAIQMLVFLVVSVGGAAWLADRMIQDSPMAFSTPPVTSAEKRRVFALLSESREAKDGKHQLVLTEKDIDFLLTWGLSAGSSQRKAKVQLDVESKRTVTKRNTAVQ